MTTDPITQAAANYVEGFADRVGDEGKAETLRVIARDLRNGFHLEDGEQA